VGYGNPIIEQHFGDEKTPMAVLGILLTAHDRYSALFDASLQSLDASPELFAARDSSVEHVAFRVVERAVIGTAAQLVAEEEVIRARSRDDVRQGGAISPLDIARVGPRTYVDQDIDFGAGEQVLESLRRVIGVA
jgi:hypothetical protein